MATEYNPPVSFSFLVKFGEDSGSGTGNQVGFQSVSGLEVSYEADPYKAGGENRFTYQLPTKAAYTNLILKGGTMRDPDLIKWCTDAFMENKFSLKNLTVSLLDPDRNALVTWNIVNAWPKKWAVSEFNAETNALAIDTIELQYQYFTVKTS